MSFRMPNNQFNKRNNMASKIKVDQIDGSSGSSITIPTGQTLTITDGLSGLLLEVVHFQTQDDN